MSNDLRWLITFGDLLTLMLGFFVIVLAQTSLTPEGSQPPVSEATLIATNPEGGKGVIPTEPGITLAKLEEGVLLPRAELVYRTGEESFREVGAELTSESLDELKKAVLSSGYVTRQVDLELCSESALGDPWLSSLTRALALKRQVIDAGVPSEVIRVRVLGAACSELRKANELEDQSVLTISVVAEGKINGGREERS